MYKAYNLSVPDGNSSIYANGANAATVDMNRSMIRQGIQKFFQEGIINVAALEEEWFGQSTPHIFLSHSHADVDLAAGIAGLVEKRLNITCFIDSFVWGYADELLLQIDNDFCKNTGAKKTSYDYGKRNRSTSHVHMMLASALTKMIDRAECVFFLNTPASIKTEDIIRDGKDKTASPWIYHELLMTKLLPSREPTRKLREGFNRSVIAREDNFPEFAYDAPLAHLTDLSVSDFRNWLSCGLSGVDALDDLYQAHS